MTLSDAALAAELERRQFICHPLEHGRVLWVVCAFGKMHEWRRGQWIPFVPTLALTHSEQWKVSPKGPRAAAPRRSKPVSAP